mmetsp:Transcript_1907/g.3462  ORF Transcript_1907/g.3462 Transcript_1907/m.3462 type:complete len:307 (-) Transcript_1907:22-942(-)
MSSLKVAPAPGGDAEEGLGSSAAPMQDQMKPAEAPGPMAKKPKGMKEIAASFPKDGSRKEQRSFIKSTMAELGIKPRWAACGCCFCAMFFMITFGMMGTGIILLTRNLTVSGNNAVLRAGNGDAVATAEATIKVNLERLRTVATDPGPNQKILRDLSELAFKITASGGTTQYITMRIAESYVEAGELKLYSPAGNYVTVAGDASVAPQFCNPTCRNIVMSRRLTSHPYDGEACCDDDVFEVYEIQQVPTEEYKEEDEVSAAGWGTKVAGIIIMVILMVIFCISAILCPQALECVLILCQCAAACAG